MKRKTQVVSIFLLSLVVISISNTAGVAQQELEWKVKVGDSKIFEYTKYFDNRDRDKDGDKNTMTVRFIDEDGRHVNVTFKKGFTFKFEITRLNGDPTVKEILDGVKLPESNPNSFFLGKTVDNKTYWKEYAEALSVGDINASVDGNLLVVKRETEEEYKHTIDTKQEIKKTDWKTGWITYWNFRRYNDTDTIEEKEIAVKVVGITPGFEMAPIILGIFVLALVVTRKRK